MTKAKTRFQYSPEVRERAVRMVQEYRQDYPSRWATIVAVAAKIGSTPQTLDNWTKQAQRPTGERRTRGARRIDPVDDGDDLDQGGLTNEERDRLRALERENQELRQQNALLRRATIHEVADVDEAELNRRERILLIASRSFLDKGYSATSVDEIAEAAGTTGPALYRFFESKQDILDNICLIGSERKLKGVQEALDKAYEDPSDTLRDLIKNRIDFALSPWGCQVPITDAEVQHLSPAARTRIETEAEVNQAEWFRCLSLVRPHTPTRVVLSIINAVIMEITYVGHHINEIDFKGDIRPILERLAWTGVIS